MDMDPVPMPEFRIIGESPASADPARGYVDRTDIDMDSIQLHRALGTEANCKHVSAGELQIAWGDNPSYWEMVDDQSSIMFPKTIARLLNVWWFAVRGEIVCSLPPGAYIVSWRAHLPADSRAWASDSDPVHFTFSKNETEVISECKCYIGRRTRSGVACLPTQVKQFSLPTIRAVENGWTEYDAGEFVVEEGEEKLCALKFAMLATDTQFRKSGLSLDGVFIRPKSSVVDAVPAQLESKSEVFDAGPSNHSRRIMTNRESGRSSLGSESRGQIPASFQAVRENMDARGSDWRVPIKLIDVKTSLASYHGGTLEIHTQSWRNPRDLDNYCIISYVWSHEDNFAVDEIGGLTRTRRTITSCSLAAFVAMLDICDQMGMKDVWIDCVCVEQENSEVKSLQLAEMGNYYSRATRCLVFLNGLNMYIPPIFEGSNIGSWYDRVWTVQEAGYTFNKKTFVHALPRVTLLESSDIITPLRIRAEHIDLIARCLTHNKYRGRTDEVCDVPPVSEWFLGLVREENYFDFWRLMPDLTSMVSFCKCHWQAGTYLQEKSNLSLGLTPNNVNQVIREALGATRECQYQQDRVYSIMTLLGVELDVSYSRSLRDTICKAAEAMSPQMLVHFITATWYSHSGNALPEVSVVVGGDFSRVVMGIFHCVSEVKVVGSELLIITKTTSVNISRVGDIGFYSSQRVVLGCYPTHGHPFLLNGDVKARGEVDCRNCDGHEKMKLVFMGKGSMKGFETNREGRMDRSSGEVPANVCLVVRHVNAVWNKVGVLYVSEDLVFSTESDHLALKL